VAQCKQAHSARPLLVHYLELSENTAPISAELYGALFEMWARYAVKSELSDIVNVYDRALSDKAMADDKATIPNAMLQIFVLLDLPGRILQYYHDQVLSVSSIHVMPVTIELLMDYFLRQKKEPSHSIFFWREMERLELQPTMHMYRLGFETMAQLELFSDLKDLLDVLRHSRKGHMLLIDGYDQGM